jgi:hypothetical protein
MAFPRIVIIICLVIVWVISTAGSAAIAGDASFAYSKAISIHGSPAGTQENYPVKMTLFNTTGTDSPGVIFLGKGGVSPAWNDIRFSGSSDVEFLPYWIESTSDRSATIWVNVPVIPPEGVDIVIRYGNPLTPDAQDGYATFTLFDHFDGNSPNPAVWTVTPGVTVSNSIATLATSSDPSHYNPSISSTAQFGIGYRIVTRIRPHDFGGTQTLEAFLPSFLGSNDAIQNQDSAYYSHIYGSSSGRYFNHNERTVVGSGEGGEITGIFPNTWNRHEAIKDKTAITWIANSGIPYTFSSEYYSGPGSVMFSTYVAGTEDVDWVFVGKYVYPEPSVLIPSTGNPATTRTVPKSIVTPGTSTPSSAGSFSIPLNDSAWFPVILLIAGIVVVSILYFVVKKRSIILRERPLSQETFTGYSAKQKNGLSHLSASGSGSSGKIYTHHDIFISYSHEDKPIADAICASLESEDIRCWIAPRDVLPGENYPAAIINAIEQCRIMVLVYSSKSNNSDHVIRELTKAVSTGAIIIPFRIEDVPPSKDMEYLIGIPHWLDALTPPLEQHIVKLVQTIQVFLAQGKKGIAL